MTVQGGMFIILFIALIVAFTRPMGAFLFALYEGRPMPLLGPVERGLYKIGGIDPAREEGWRGYAIALLLFNLFGVALIYAVLRLQGVLPFNPQGFGAVS